MRAAGSGVNSPARGRNALRLCRAWDCRDGAVGAILSCGHLTTEPNQVAVPIHDRVSPLLPASAYDLGLDPDVKDPKKPSPLLVPFSADGMEAYLVGPLVNDPANDVARCIRGAD